MSFDPEKITFFAKTDARGQQVPFGIKAKDRQRHMYVVGKTGMGKSTLLENMAAQDIQNGEGMAFIDPHGSAAETLLEYVPEHRINDVIYFAPFDLNNPISFNVMEDVGPDKRHLVVSGLMSTFKKIWVDAWSARMEYILTNALLALIEYPDTTLLSVNRLFSDKAYRAKVVDYIKDPAVKAFWTEEFAGYTDRFMAEALPAIQNKIGQFTGNPLIRNIIGQPHSSFDIRQIMDEKKILIMNLSKGLVGETNANLLGSMLTTRIYLGAMSRADLPVEKMRTMPNFYFYVDEFQSFANATFANILSEARKYHLNLIIAHQYIEQMEEDVRNAVFGNVGTTIAFRVGPFDAEVLETVFAPRFTATDLVNLGFAQIYLTLMIDGIGSQPFSAITLPPIQRPQISYKEIAVTASRKNYTKNRDEVEKIVADLHTPVKVEASKKKALNNNHGNNINKNPDFKRKSRPETEQNNFYDQGKRLVEKNKEGNFNESALKRNGGNNFSLKNEKTNAMDEVFINRDKYQGEQKQKFNDKQNRNENIYPKKSVADLREVLKGISGGNDKGKSERGDDKPKPREKEKNEPSQNNDREKKSDDLKRALSSLLVNNKDVKNIDVHSEIKEKRNLSFNTHKKNQEKLELEKLSAEVETAFSGIDTKNPVTTSMTDSKENLVQTYDTNISHKRVNQFIPRSVANRNDWEYDDPLSADKIKKKLRQSRGNERSPFAA
ncbi:MAG: type IV secretion system DNA-binding domain-containing protein [Candidatus Paceibacterota bacterium]